MAPARFVFRKVNGVVLLSSDVRRRDGWDQQQENRRANRRLRCMAYQRRLDGFDEKRRLRDPSGMIPTPLGVAWTASFDSSQVRFPRLTLLEAVEPRERYQRQRHSDRDFSGKSV